MNPRKSVAALVATAGVALGGGMLAGTPTATAYDEVAYLLNVTVRPGYNFPNAQAALAYGYGICDKIRNRTPFAQQVADIKRDFNTSDEYQATYLISQAAQELCPQDIFQLRESAAGYVPPPPPPR